MLLTNQHTMSCSGGTLARDKRVFCQQSVLRARSYLMHDCTVLLSFFLSNFLFRGSRAVHLSLFFLFFFIPEYIQTCVGDLLDRLFFFVFILFKSGEHVVRRTMLGEDFTRGCICQSAGFPFLDLLTFLALVFRVHDQSHYKLLYKYSITLIPVSPWKYPMRSKNLTLKGCK